MIFFRRGSWKSYMKAGAKAYQQGNYPEAEKQLAAALKEAEGFGTEDDRLAMSLNNLAGLYQTQRKYAEAEPPFKRSLAIREKALGPEHPDVGQSLNNLAEAYKDQDKYAEAQPLYERALAIWEKTLGPEHPYVAMSLNGLAADPRLTKGNLAPFHGVYDGEITLRGEAGEIRVILRRQGARVTGQYSYPVSAGSLLGRVEGDVLVFEWREGGDRGRGTFRVHRGGDSFTGTWGMGRSADNGGSWNGARVRQ